MIPLHPSRLFDRHTQPHIATLILLASISALAMNIFLPSLPKMAEHYNSTPAIMGLSVGIYLGASAIIQIFAGPISDAIGRRPVVLWSLMIFIIASILAPFATTVHTFLALRALQATAACSMVLARAIIRDTTDTDKAGSKLAYVTMGMSVVPMLSPTIGGFLDKFINWQASFYLTAFLGLMLLVVSYLDLGETAPNTGGSLRKQIGDYPELLTSPRFWGYCMASALGSGAFFAYLGGGPFVGSVVFHLTPEALGIYFGAPAFGYFIGNYISGRFSVRFGIDRMISWGLVTTLLGLSISLVLSYLGFGSALSFFGSMTIVGLGNGMTIPNATAGMLSVRPKLAGTASGLGSAIMIGGGAALSALAGVALDGQASEIPLLWLMWCSVILGVFCIYLVIKRKNQIANSKNQSSGQ